jgi:hypothetical protein
MKRNLQVQISDSHGSEHRHDTLILLHVRFPWQPDVGALTRNNWIVQHCCVSLATQQCWTALASLPDNNVNKQHCYARNNRQAFLWLRNLLSSNFYWYNQCVGIRSSTDVCIWLRTPFGWRLSSYREIVREAREFIPWTMKTFDRRGW